MARLRARLADLTLKHLYGIGAAVVTVALVYFGQIEWLELRSLDWLFELRGARATAAPIVIVTIDESSFQELELQWPFPRAMHGKLIDRISAGKPLVIGVDLIFDAPSSFGPADDEAFGAAVARAGNVVLALATAEDRQRLEDVEVQGVRLQLNREVSNMPLPIISRGAAAVAPVSVRPDPDSNIRRMPVRARVPDEQKGYEWLLSFDAQLHRLATAARLPTKPLPAVNEILVNFRGRPRTFRWVPYYRVVRGDVKSASDVVRWLVEIDPEEFRGKIVLVGPTNELAHDLHPTAFARGGDMPGVEIHANAIETFVRGNPIHEVPKSVSTAVAFVAALTGSALVVRLHAFRALVVAVLLWVVGTLLALAGFAFADVWMRGMAGTAALVLGYGATVVEHFVREQREKRRLSQFFSPDVLRAVVRDRDKLSLGSSRRLVTVLFSDIRDFTSISERLQPEVVAEMLREYLTEMTQIVFKHGGTVDKYIGDCVMALYNVPFDDSEHALNAIRTGLEFQERTLAVSAKWEAKLGVPIRNGVGINTGVAIVGTLGSRQRLEYTAIGDTVNLASRLESITKNYDESIIISESTYECVKDRFPTRELGDVTVKGKSQPVKIYGVRPSSKRKHPRRALDAAAVLTAVGDGQVCRVRTVDISEGGLALTGVPPEWQVGSKIQIRLEGGGLPRRVEAEGTILSRRGDNAGVQFASMDEDSAPTVADYVARGQEAPAPR